jgi:pimeloyl-ACP methyl ester carboxylesterase
MLAARARLAPAGPSRPPVVLVHGAANSAGVWTLWQAELAQRGWSSWAVDLRGHGDSPAEDLGRTAMSDYADDVATVIREMRRPPVVIGWSMGGLAAMMAAARGGVAAYVGLGPSVPTLTRDRAMPLRAGTFDAAEYGIVSADPADQPTMPDLDLEERRMALASLGLESRLARDDRKAGVVIPSLPCPALVVAGTADAIMPPRTYADLPIVAEALEAPAASHWGLVLSRRTLATLVPAVTSWLERAAAGSAASAPRSRA